MTCLFEGHWDILPCAQFSALQVLISVFDRMLVAHRHVAQSHHIGMVLRDVFRCETGHSRDKALTHRQDEPDQEYVLAHKNQDIENAI